MGCRVYGFRVLGLRVYGFRVLGLSVLGFRVLGLSVLGLGSPLQHPRVASLWGRGSSKYGPCTVASYPEYNGDHAGRKRDLLLAT